jgi:hypothetical protein
MFDPKKCRLPTNPPRHTMAGMRKGYQISREKGRKEGREEEGREGGSAGRIKYYIVKWA